ncbi:MAG TPA: isochorismatase family protein, partial [Streptosporangiaceae bacterium]
LESLGVTQVVLTGISTSSGVESTARDAHELGFNVTLAVDAMTDTRPASHDYSIGFVFPRIGETGTTDQVIDLLDQSRCGRASSCSP